MDPTIVVRATGDFRRLYAEQSRAESKFGALGSKAKAALAGAAVVGTAALVKLSVAAVGSASAAEQSIGATESVFGKYADTVIKRSKEAADAVGLSANEYRELSNVTGAMLASAGTPMRKVTGLTAQLTERAADMAATFGGSTADAIRAVSALLRGETDPIEQYGVSIKQSDINARLAAKGLDKLTGEAKKQAEQQERLALLFQQTKKTAGQFGREADTIAGKGQRLGAKVDDLEAKFGDLLIPALSEAADWASEELVPALDDLADWLEANKDEFAEFGGTIKDTVLPPLKGAVELAKDAVGVFGDLPAPVKELGVQAAVAAMVLPRLTAGMTTASASASAMVGNLRNAETRTAALGSALRTTAGVGGMVALTQGAQSSNDAIKLLSSTAGGALTGFAVGGPWGAAIGAGAGALLGLTTATSGADKAARESTTTWATYAATLDAVTGSTTRATEAMVLEELRAGKLLNTAAQLGIDKTTLVQGVLGEAKARETLAAAIDVEEQAIRDAVAAYEERFKTSVSRQSEEAQALAKSFTERRKNLDALKAETGEITKATQAKREDIAIMAKIPDAVITRFQTPGAVDSRKEVRQLSREYGLTPKQVRTLLEVTGVGKAVKDVDKFVASVGVDAPKKAKAGGRQTGKAITDGASAALLPGLDVLKAELTSGVKGSTNKAKRPALTGGQDVGGNLGLGMYNGLSQWLIPLQTRAGQMVREAVRSAKAAGKIESPSKETKYLGAMLGEGLAVGIDASAPLASLAGGKLGKKAVAAIAAGVTGGSSGIEDALSKITGLVEKSIKGKGEKQREKRVLKALKDQYGQLRANGAAQDAINASLETARGLLEQATGAYSDYANAARDAVVATGDLTRFGRQDDGTVSIKSLLEEMDKAVIDAERFQSLMGDLAGSGLSKDAIDRMLAAGPDAALATAEAIKDGGAESVKRINDLQSRLNAAGATLGADMARRYYQTGIDAAQGLVNGLLSDLADVQAAGEAIGAALIKATKKKLKSKSPSREFVDIGRDVLGGLAIGVDDTYAARIGSGAAASLVKGFAVPQISADVLTTGWGGSSAPLRVEARLTAEQLSAAQRGKAILLDIDAARGQGGSAKAVVGP